LEVWHLAMDLAAMVYQISLRFPPEARYGMTSQIQRAAISVPANIAEGKGRATSREYAHFVAIARGSLGEVETYLLLAERFSYVSEAETKPALSLIIRINQMLNSLRRRLQDNH
jgi:four helix bundle protein